VRRFSKIPRIGVEESFVKRNGRELGFAVAELGFAVAELGFAVAK
jgi:hypothetical protein